MNINVKWLYGRRICHEIAFSHLGKHEEVGKGGNGKADSDAQNKEADKIGAAGCLLERWMQFSANMPL